MTISTSNYNLREASFSDEQIKSILSGAAGLNPRSVEMFIDHSVSSYGRVKLSEKTLNISSGTNDKSNPLEESNVNMVLGHLDEWAGTQNGGNRVAMLAAEVIRALIARN